jgi:hypothetical protein
MNYEPTTFAELGDVRPGTFIASPIGDDYDPAPDLRTLGRALLAYLCVMATVVALVIWSLQ